MVTLFNYPPLAISLGRVNLDTKQTTMTYELTTTATLILRFVDEHEMRQYVQRKTESKPVDVHMACLYLSEWTDQAHTGYFFYPCGVHQIEVKFRPELPYKFLLE